MSMMTPQEQGAFEDIFERLAKLEALVETTVRTIGLLQDRLDQHQEEEEQRSDILTSRLEREDEKLSSSIYQLERDVSSLQSEVRSMGHDINRLNYAVR